MPITVTCRMFSGRPNPSWVLSDLDEAQFRAVLLRLDLTINQPVFRFGGLGYYGFRVVTDGLAAVAGPTMTVYSGTVDFGESAARRAVDVGRRLEQLLLDTFSRESDPQLARIATKQFQKKLGEAKCSGEAEGDADLPSRPKFEPQRWNTDAVAASNNCYSYANNRRFTTGEHATPGEGGGDPVVSGTCGDISRGAKKDGLEAVNAIPDDATPLALFVSKESDGDYHWYRQDKSGLWSHKPGHFSVRNCDESGKPIEDPRKANALHYGFCGFFVTNTLAAKKIR